MFALLFQEGLSLKSENGQATIPIATMSDDSLIFCCFFEVHQDSMNRVIHSFGTP